MDGDAIAYRIAAASERETEWHDGEITLSTSLPAVFDGIDQHLDSWKRRFDTDQVRIAISDQPWTFRMSLYKPYKEHRKDKRKPLGLAKVRQWLIDERGGVVLPGLEADDLMGLWMTDPSKHKDDGIIVSWDKDMRAVPGRFWVPGTEPVEHRNEHEADLMWFAQSLSGDAADGYPGCKNVGVVRAQRIVEKAYLEGQEMFGVHGYRHVEHLWETVKREYEKKGQTEADALVTARLARILRHGDYNLKTKEVTLWTPPGDPPSSSASTVTLPAPVRARVRNGSYSSRTKRASRWTWSASPIQSVARRVKSSPAGGARRKSVSTLVAP